jgi:DNA-binding MarR family transcriptional regulator
MTTPPLRPATSAGYQVNRLARLFEAALRARVTTYGVVPGQFPALLALYQREGHTQQELCQIASVDQSTMAKTLARMKRDRLVRTERDARDSRRTRYYLTARARALEPDLAAAGHAVIAQATSGIPPAMLATFDQVLAKMASNLTAGPGLPRRPAPRTPHAKPARSKTARSRP